MTAVLARPGAPPRRRPLVRPLWLAGAFVLLAAVVLASIAFGSKAIGPNVAFDAIFHNAGTSDETVVRQLRVPRTLLGILVGAGLGAAGALMQALTRNPLADPGLLGVNSGASAAIVLSIGVLHLASPLGYLWFGFLGAAVVSVVVYLLGARGASGATPVRLALSGTAVTAALTAFISGALLLDPLAFDQFRFWDVGALSGASYPLLTQVTSFLVVGLLAALGLARPLNVLALGEETGKALGVNLNRSRVLVMLTVTLLCGTATAAVGPIVFVGLIVPHLARALVGTDQRWVLPLSMLLGANLLLGADVIGRVVLAPGELEVGIVTAFVGAPVFIALVRRRRIPQL